MIEALLVVAGYLCGSLPFGYCLVRWFRGTDSQRRQREHRRHKRLADLWGAAGIAVVLLDTLNKMQLRRRVGGLGET